MPSRKPRLTLAHSTLAARNLDELCAFYCNALGFHVTNRGPTPDGGELCFISQDPHNHHQVVLVRGVEPPTPAFMMVDHLAFRTGSLDDLRAIRANLVEAGVSDILPIFHGNAWSLYFTDCEGNGVECFVDTPFHVAQPFADAYDLDQADEEILDAARSRIESEPEFQPMSAWQAALEEKVEAQSRTAPLDRS